MMINLPYLSEPAEEKLFTEVEENLERYRGDGFSEFAGLPEWTIQCRFAFDPKPLSLLSDENSDGDNALLVWQALSQLSPSLAAEGRIWTRLSHVECFKYCRDRWPLNGTHDEVTASIRRHFFARTLTGRRDDNSISRLWWTAWVANTMAEFGDISEPLRWITKRADIRSSLIERSMMMSRPTVAKAIVSVMRDVPAVTDTEGNFRSFMKTLNRSGGGIVFECLTENQAVVFIKDCAKRALKA